ncbi:LacI family DNA-binding transcriptional regulator [Phototrophicus methaneseepsis]|uniref:LacI family DNA-binding transcriptional regulator n=1 Tax=Phototrophicus methaneseepsis TaxID=2710758 RepID=A0A7S8E8R6_9CHLR|nr:LacI family DNA-binding transcriptional regulator [Phototrophicus methaneseepsis]QPC82358.1 LacI family DNA-binding transcriptional regulator [Phototrophicus methaneseepsis]
MPSIIQQIAEDLNVSSASVSRALNDRPGVGDALRARILERARELNYTSSVIARGLATSQTFSLGFFVRQKPGLSTHSDPFYGEIMQGVEETCAQSDYHVTIGSLTDDVIENPQSFRFVREGRVDGMILAGPDIPSGFILAMLQTDLPVVLVDNNLPISRVHCINANSEEGAYQAASYLLELGHRRIGILSGPAQWPSNAKRVWGYTQALHEAGIEPTIVYADATTIDSGLETASKLLKESPDVTGILAVNDSMAIGAIRFANAAGYHVPQDLSVIGFDNIAWARFNNPPLTTLHIPKNQMGKEAAKRLLELLGDPDIPPTNLTVGVDLVKRATCDVPNRGGA